MSLNYEMHKTAVETKEEALQLFNHIVGVASYTSEDGTVHSKSPEDIKRMDTMLLLACKTINLAEHVIAECKENVTILRDETLNIYMKDVEAVVCDIEVDSKTDKLIKLLEKLGGKLAKFFERE